MHHTIRLSQMRIGVDLDGVVADFTHGWTSQYKKDFGKEILEKILLNGDYQNLSLTSRKKLIFGIGQKILMVLLYLEI